MLNTKEQEFALDLARRSIEHFLTSGRRLAVKKASLISQKFTDPGATFVTLKKDGQLRGCIGSLKAQLPLYQDLINNALSAAFADPRFLPLSSLAELKQCRIEISILNKPTPIKAKNQMEKVAKIRPGVDGIILEYQGRKSTFLPTVWSELPEKSAFLNHLAQKAGLPIDIWHNPDCQLSTYQVQKIEEK